MHVCIYIVYVPLWCLKVRKKKQKIIPHCSLTKNNKIQMFRWSYHWNSHSTTFHHVRGRHPLGLVGDPRRWMERHHLVVADLKDARPFEGSCQPCCGASNKLNMHTHTDLLVRTHIYIYIQTCISMCMYIYIYTVYIIYIYCIYYIYIYCIYYIYISLCVCEDVASPRDQSSIIQATVPPADATSQKWRKGSDIHSVDLNITNIHK